MKKLFFSILLIVPFLVGCDALKELTKIPLPIEESIIIPAVPVPGSVTVETPSIETGIDSVLKSAGIGSDVVEEVLLSEMEFVLSNGSGDLGFLDNVDVYITASGQTDVKVASASNIGSVSTVKFKTEKADIKKFILGQSFKLKIVLKTDKPSLSETSIDVKMKFILDLKVLGL